MAPTKPITRTDKPIDDPDITDEYVVFKTAHVRTIVKWANMFINGQTIERRRYFRNTDADKAKVRLCDERIEHYKEILERAEALLNAS